MRRMGPSWFLPALVFAAAVLGGTPLWRTLARPAGPAAATALEMRSRSSGDVHGNHLTPQQQWLAHLRALLSAGDVAAVQAELNRMAREQPFLALEAIHRLVNLGDQIDLDEPGCEAARRLPWGDPRSAKALNGISISRTGFDHPGPWGSYLAAQTGLRAPEEIYAEAQKAFYDGDRQEVYADWAHAEAVRNPEGFVPLLTGAGLRDIGLWREFFGGLQERPEMFPVILARIPPESRYEYCITPALESWLYVSPKLETLKQTTQYLPPEKTFQMMNLGILYADPEQHGPFLDYFHEQPPYLQVVMLDQMLMPATGNTEELLPVLEMCPTLHSQVSAVLKWFSASNAPGRAVTGKEWRGQLSSAKLQEKVKEIMGF